MSKQPKQSEELIADGLNAGLLMDSETFIEACATLKANILQEWMVAKAPHLREMAHAKTMALDGILKELRILVDRGRDAHTRLKAKQRGRQR